VTFFSPTRLKFQRRQVKILIVSSLYHPNIVGGAEKVAQNLAEGLVARGHEAVVATTSPRRHSEVMSVDGVRVHYVPVRNLYFITQNNGRSDAVKALWHGLDTYNPFMASSLGRILDAERPDVVNTHNLVGFSVSAWSAIKSRRLPLVHTAHDHYLLCPRSTMHRNGKNCTEPCSDCAVYGGARRRFTKLVDIAMAPSRFMLNRHLSAGCFPTAERKAVYNCCELPSELKTAGEGADHPLRFGFLGALHSGKGIDLLVQAYLALPKGEAELVIAGRGTPDYERELREMTHDRPEIRWLGFVPHQTLLGQVDVLVVPSRWHDSAPVVVLEGMAYGIPLIGSRRGGIPELMGEGTGWIFDPDEPDSLIRVMKLAISSRSVLAGMSERAGERARRFSTEIMVSEYLGAFSRAIQHKN